MGGDTKLNTRTQCAIGSGNCVGSNMCAIQPLALCLKLIGSRCNLRTPSRKRVEIMPNELGMGEYRNATTCFDRSPNPQTLTGYEMRDTSIDATSVGRDRNFERMGMFLKNMCPSDESFRLRISDVEYRANQSFSACYRYVNGGTETPLDQLGMRRRFTQTPRRPPLGLGGLGGQ